LARRLSSTGTTLVVVAADATDETAMSALFDRFGTELPAVEGIYLAAFAGGPVALSDMTDDDVNTMFRPKLDALGVLHALSLRTAVQQFVLFSSISGLLGSRWLAHYTATSTFLDTFAYARRNLGLPATVVNWGLWKSLADLQSDANQVMSNSGLAPMSDEVAIRALPVVMGPDAPVRSTVVDADWPLLAAAYRTRGALRIVNDLLADDDATDQVIPESEFRKALRECSPERRRELLAEHIGTLASDVMGLAPTEILDPAAGFFQLGMDSLMSVTLQRSLSASLGITLPAAVIYEYPTISCLTDALCERMGYATAAENPGGQLDSGLGARAQQRALARQGAHASRRKRTWGMTMANDYPTASDECHPTPIAVIGMAGRFPGADSVTTFWDNLRRGEESIATALRGGTYRRRSQCEDAGRSGLRSARAPARRDRGVRRGILRDDPVHRSDDGPSTAAVLADRVARLRGFRVRPRHLRRSDRRLRRQYRQRLPDGQPDVAPQPQGARRRGHHRRDVQPGLAERQGLPGDAGVAPVQSARTESFGADRLLVVAGRGAPRVPEPAVRRMRHGAGRCRLDPGAASRWLHLRAGAMVSASGHCRPFDVRSDGTIFGSGVAAVILKPLQAALDDGDRIHAVIRGSAINNDGSVKMTYAAPALAGQAEVIAEAHAVAGVDSSTIGFVETHGTGTPLGDPIEIEALRQAFEVSSLDRSGPCVLGSVKSNVGHLDAASGVTGLIKTILCLKNKAIPPTVHYTAPNPELHLENTPFVVQNTYTPWESEHRAGLG
jgi:acyl carrier protein